MCEGQELFFRCILGVADHIESEGQALRLHSKLNMVPCIERIH